MIGHISPLGLSTSNPAIQPMALTDAAGIGDANQTGPVEGSGLNATGLTDAVSMMQLNSQVGEMLQAIGGGLEGNKTLQMMIALLILVTLLGGSSQPGSSANALQDLASSAGRGGSYLSVTSTSFSFEQTTLTVATTSPDAFTASAPTAETAGRKIDVAA